VSVCASPLFSMADLVAPQSGHVSNFCGSVDPLIEHSGVYCFRAIRAQPDPWPEWAPSLDTSRTRQDTSGSCVNHEGNGRRL
jgi:hypothetical protein